MRLRLGLLAAASLALSACGSSSSSPEQGTNEDAAPSSDGGTAIDAATIDAAASDGGPGKDSATPSDANTMADTGSDAPPARDEWFAR